MILEISPTVTNTLDFTRTFHPVGQGAFYSERFTFNQNVDFLTIYDCGTDLENKKLGSEDQILSGLESRIHQDLGIVDQATGKHDVQLLFLSHFDQDHVCGVHTLDPRIVVIPLLTQDEITCYELIDFLQISKINWNLLRNPKRFFGNRTKVIGIEPDEEESNLSEQPEAIEINEEGSIRNVNENAIYDSYQQRSNVDMTISSGIPIRLRNLWQYIAFNPKISKLNEFKRALTAAGWDWNTLADDLKSNLSKDKVKELRDIYKNISPTGKLDLNTTSLLVYSGPTEQLRPFHIRRCIMSHSYCSNRTINESYERPRIHRSRLACMYFGDWKISVKKLLQYIKHVPSNGNQIGTVQIPHHGSGYNNGHYALKYLNNPRRIISVISVGNDNRHRHPSNKTISDIMMLGSNIVLVTDDNTSAFITQWQLSY